MQHIHDKQMLNMVGKGRISVSDFPFASGSNMLCQGTVEHSPKPPWQERAALAQNALRRTCAP
jgi:hypothetical protein